MDKVVNEIHTKVFIETSIHYNRLHGTKRQKAEIKKHIDGHTEIYSSVYVLREFHNIFSKPLIEFCSFIDNYDDISEAIKEFKAANPFKHRKTSILLDLASTLLFEIISETATIKNKHQAIAKIKSYIPITEGILFRDVKHWVDNMHLKISRYKHDSYSNLEEFVENIKEIDKDFDYCRYLKLKKTDLDKLYKFDSAGIKPARSSIKNEFNKILKPIYYRLLAGETISNNHILSHLGDTMIALESPGSCLILSHDQIFHILPQPLDKKAKVILQPKKIK